LALACFTNKTITKWLWFVKRDFSVAALRDINYFDAQQAETVGNAELAFAGSTIVPSVELGGLAMPQFPVKQWAQGYKYRRKPLETIN
jgi:hypothetical protein